MGSATRKDWKARQACKAQPCSACRTRQGVDPAHVRGWKISQCDAWWNMIPLCRAHHNEQHEKGWLWMSDNYFGVEKALAERDWKFEVSYTEAEGVTGAQIANWSMYNELEVQRNEEARSAKIRR